MMTTFGIRTGIDLYDVQGNVLKGYGSYGFPVARYVLYRINSGAAGRSFVERLLPLLTNAAPWGMVGNVKVGPPRPAVTTNIAFTFDGLRRLGVPEKSLQSFPDDFAMGMRARSAILGDDGVSDPSGWDPVWQSESQAQPVHILVTINAVDSAELEQRYGQLSDLVDQVNDGHPADDAGAEAAGPGVEQLRGHERSPGPDGPSAWQAGGALLDDDGNHTNTEHFGYADGITDPFVKGSGKPAAAVVGAGKPVRDGDPTTPAGWAPLATGEFLLGHVDEADEYPAAPIPSGLAKNGTFLVYRKLHQNVAAFNRFLADEAARIDLDEELLAAKLAGRWRNGAPLVDFPTHREGEEFVAEFVATRRDRHDPSKSDEERQAAEDRYRHLKSRFGGFTYREDLAGGRCPVGSHVRRTNPRGALEFGVDGAFDTPGALVNRRRLARRGLPYGQRPTAGDDRGEHGIIFMAIGASISRQFEFVQQQWVNYGNDFRLANDRDPLIGNHSPAGGRMVIEADPSGDDPPRFCAAIPRFVETRGGDYFFVPSLTALADLAAGTIDPT